MVLFTSVRPLERAENLKAVYDAYGGPKEYVQRKWNAPIPGLHSGKYRLMVTDELLNDSPGKSIWIGHGMGAGKTYGLQQPKPYYRHTEALTYAIASSVDMIPVVARFCGISESRVIPIGMPRTDAYFGVEKEKSDYKKHLYVPTFRRGYWMPDFNKVWRCMPEGHQMTVKLHMVTGDKFHSFWQNIKTAPSTVPSTPYLINTDTVITDYSSIMFDAMVLRKPVILFAKDRQSYLSERGMFYPYPDKYSNNYCEREEDLAKLMTTAAWDDHAEDLRRFYAGACDGHSTERLINFIGSIL